jgi:anti-sigma factor RsiW
MPEKLHLTDEELLLVADGEISARGGEQARQHLADCPACRVRLVEIRRAAADFARAHREDLNVLPDDAARANLKARLADLSSDSTRLLWRDYAANLFVGPRWAYVVGVLLVAALGLRLLPHNTLLSTAPEMAASSDAASRAEFDAWRNAPN